MCLWPSYGKLLFLAHLTKTYNYRMYHRVQFNRLFLLKSFAQLKSQVADTMKINNLEFAKASVRV